MPAEAGRPLVPPGCGRWILACPSFVALLLRCRRQ
jgi:hypothetical protein